MNRSDLLKLTRRTSLAAALLAGTAIIAPQQAHAQVAIALDGTGGNDVVAPFTTAFQARANRRVNITTTLNAAMDDANVRTYAIFYDSNDVVLGIQLLSTAAGGATISTGSALLSNLPSANRVAFVFTSGAGGDDTLGGGTVASDRVGVIRLQADNNDVAAIVGVDTTAAPFNIADHGGNLATLTALNQQAVGDAVRLNNAANLNTLSTTYDFTAQSANKSLSGGVNTACIYVTFNAFTGTVADGGQVNAGMTVSVGGTADTDFGADDCTTGTANVATNTTKTIKFDNDAAAGTNTVFSGLIDTVTFAGGATAPTAITDAAGNNPVAATLTPVPTLSPPSFSATGTAKGIVQLTGGQDTAAKRAALYGTGIVAGTSAFGSAEGVVSITLRLQEGVTNFNDADDLVLPASLNAGTFANAAATGNNISFDVAAAATHFLRICNDGRLFTQPTAGATGWDSVACTGSGSAATALSIDIKNGASAMTTTVGGIPIAAATGAPTQIYAGTSRGIISLKTLDAAGGAADGSIDGVTITFGNPVQGSANGSGIQLVDRQNATTPLAGGTTVSPAAPTSSTAITAVATTPADLTALVSTGESQDTDADNLNGTPTVANKLPPYLVRINTPAWTYTNVYETTNGNNATIDALTGAQAQAGNVAFFNDGGIRDGAAAFLVSATRHTGTSTGEFRLVFSEAIADNSGSTNVIQTNTTSSLALDQLNTSDTSVATFTRLASDTSNKTLRVQPVGNAVINATSSIGIAQSNQSASGATRVVGATDNTPAATRSVALGAATALADTTGPTIVGAVGVVDANNRLTNVLVAFSENIQAVGSNIQDRFNLDVTDPAISDVGFASASINGKFLNLVLPGSGIFFPNIENTTIDIDYSGTASSYIADTAGTPNAIGGAPASSVGNTNVQIPQNSRRTFTQEIRGKVTTDGTTAVEQGSIVRADLVRFSVDSNQATGATISAFPGSTRPLTLEAATADIFTVGNGANLANTLRDEAALGKTTIPAYVVIDARASTGASAVAANNATTENLRAFLGLSIADARGGSGSAGGSLYTVSINTATGAITGPVTGQVNLSPNVQAKRLTSVRQGATEAVNSLHDQPSLAVVDASGGFRLNLGTNTDRSGMFVMLSLLRAGESTWTLLTSADPSMASHLPFGQDLTTSATGQNTNSTTFPTTTGANGTTVRNYRLDRIAKSTVANFAGGWQTVGVQGELLRNTTALTQTEARRLLTTIETGTGKPFSLWYETSSAAADSELDEAFTLRGNSVRSSFEMSNATNVENIRDAFGSGDGLALRTASGGGNTIFFPLNAATAAPRALGAGWHLVTAQASNSDPATFGGTTAATQRVDMIIQAGGSSQVKTWLRDAATNSVVATNNTLTSLTAGQPYFIFLSAPVPAFNFQ